ncbi:MAG: hypothetical protein J7D61_17155, partial [Marichromatium sp.]|nr:hypothetical protein [Marichromatium sp.]
MEISLSFNAKNATLGGALIGVAGIAHSLAEPLLQKSTFLFFLLLALVALGFLLIISGFVDIHLSRCTLLRHWDLNLLLRRIKSMEDGEELRFMNSYIPETEEIIPTLEEICLQKNKKIAIKILLPDFINHPEIATARFKYRTDRCATPIESIRDNARSFLELKKAIKSKEKEADVQVRLYDHLPIGGYYQVGTRMMQLAFFYTKQSGNAGPALFCDGIHTEKWKIFSRNFGSALTDRVLSRSMFLV